MTMPAVSMRIRKSMTFFDPDKIIRGVDRQTRKFMGRFGGYVRKVAVNSMKKRAKRHDDAPTGAPPFAHEGAIRRLLFYAYDAPRKTVVVGPMRFGTSPYGQTTVPELHEYGGTVSRTVDGERRTFHYPPRPFMGPAFEAGKQRIDTFWAEAQS